MKRSVCLAAGVMLLAAVPSRAVEAPVAVSPGETSKLALIGDTCPTFSWGGVEGARSFELVVYRLGEEGEEAKPVLRQDFAGSVDGWTPSLDLCLERGGQYAWSVRAIGKRGSSAWSAPSLFQVASDLSYADFTEALQVVRWYLAEHEPPDRQAEEPWTRNEPSERVGDSVKPPRRRARTRSSLKTAEAALHAEPTGTKDAVVAVRGVVNSSSGAAGVFDNTGGGTVLAGLSKGTEVFEVSAAGIVSAAQFTGSHQGDGALLFNVAADELFCIDCVSSLDVLNNSLTSNDLGANAVTSSEIEDGAVGSAEIAQGAIRGSNLGEIVVVAVNCLGECSDITLEQACADEPGSWTAFAVDCILVDTPSSQSDCQGLPNKRCGSFLISDSHPLSDYCDPVGDDNDFGTFDAHVYCLAD